MMKTNKCDLGHMFESVKLKSFLILYYWIFSMIFKENMVSKQSNYWQVWRALWYFFAFVEYFIWWIGQKPRDFFLLFVSTGEQSCMNLYLSSVFYILLFWFIMFCIHIDMKKIFLLMWLYYITAVHI